MNTEAGDTARRGRPRDPDIEDRVLDAAIALYAEAGWAGFNFEAVARRAGVGKPAVYRRWDGRGSLLAQTIDARWYQVTTIREPDLRSDLLALAETILVHLTGPHGMVVNHIRMDLALYPEVRQAIGGYSDSIKRAAGLIVKRAVARGELPRGTKPALVLDLVVGGLHNHVLQTPFDLWTRMTAEMYDYAEQLVDATIVGVRSLPPREAGRAPARTRHRPSRPD